MNKQRVFIGAAWPYANGSLHLGHAASLIGADILARYYRSKGSEVLFVSGSDCHGTPIAVEADRAGVSPAAIAGKYHKEFLDTLVRQLRFSYDIFTTTTTETHKQTVQELFLNLLRKGYIYKKTEELPYCEHCKRFLPDRYIEGECPKCSFDPARGDQCDNCGNLVDVRELVNPHCKLCKNVPVWKSSEHFFLKLSAFHDKLADWIKSSTGWRSNAKNFSLQSINQGIPDRSITRDTQWGVPIPLDGYEDKRIYVWFEAVCGYLSASKEWAESSGDPDSWHKFWDADKPALHYYVHGKDNIPFHTIVWPAILFGAGGLNLPSRIVSSEYLTLNNEQFSKSRGHGIWLPDFLAEYEPDLLRYYLTVNGPETSDADFNSLEFSKRVNGELIGTLGNLVHRTLSFIKKHYPDGVLLDDIGNDVDAVEVITNVKKSYDAIGKDIEDGNFRNAFQSVLRIAEQANRYITKVAPWKKVGSDREAAGHDLALLANIIRNIGVLVSPFLPTTSEKILFSFGISPTLQNWAYTEDQRVNIAEVSVLFKKLEKAG